MESEAAVSPPDVSALHDLILSVQSTLTDEVVVVVRALLAAGEVDDATEALRFALLRSRTPLSAQEFHTLSDVLAALAGVPDDERPPLPTDLDDPERTLAYTIEPPDPALSTSESDLLAWLREPGTPVLGARRALRRTPGASYPPPRAVWLIEVADEDARAAVIRHVYGDTRADLLADVYVTGRPLPDLHAAVRAQGAIVHAAGVGDGFRIAAPPSVPDAAADRVPPEDVPDLLALLSSRGRVVAAGTTADDVLDPARTGAVPLDLRTDGTWIWTDATAYYLEHHGVAPPADLVEHLRAATSGQVSDVAADLAVRWLRLVERGEAERALAQVLLLVQSIQDCIGEEAGVEARRAAAALRLDLVTAVLAGSLGQTAVRPSTTERDLLVKALTDLGADAAALARLPTDDGPRPLLARYEPGPPAGELDGDHAVARLAAVDGVLGVWRCVRHLPGHPPRPVHVVETRDAATLRAVNDVAYGGEAPVAPTDPLVEAYVSGHAQPLPQQYARRAGVLVHVGVAVPQFALVPVFGHDASGLPTTAEEVSGDVADRLLALLAAGRTVRPGDAPGDDDLAPEPQRGVVPTGLRTDGRWIWSEATEYYLRHHRVSPPDPFRRHLDAADPAPAPPPDVVVDLAARWLDHRDAAPAHAGAHR